MEHTKSQSVLNMKNELMSSLILILYYILPFFQARIKKIMQTDEDVGKVAAPVPVIISRALELFVENLLKKANQVTLERGARTLTPSHL